MLYTISISPYYMDFKALTNLLEEKDEILLFQDGVLIGQKNILTNKDNNYLVQLKDKKVCVFALQDDVEGRGLILYMSSYVRQISYVDFVQLTVKHQQYFFW